MYDNKRKTSGSNSKDANQKLGTGRAIGSQEYATISQIKKDMAGVMSLDNADADEDVIEINRELSAQDRAKNVLLKRVSKVKQERAKNMAATVGIYAGHASSMAKIEVGLQKTMAKASQDLGVSMLDLMEVQADDRGFTKYVDGASSLLTY
jgi:hypothetical protein